MMKRKLFFLTVLKFASVGMFGQTILFADNFDRSSLPEPPVSPSLYSSFSGTAGSTSTITTNAGTYTGVNTSLWKLDSSNGTSGLNAIYSSTSSSYTTNLSVQGTSSTTSFRFAK